MSQQNEFLPKFLSGYPISRKKSPEYPEDRVSEFGIPKNPIPKPSLINITKCLKFGNSTNKKISYDCECKDGYEGDGFTCNFVPEIDECASEIHDCHASGVCLDSRVGFDCQCGENWFDENPLNPGKEFKT